MGVIVAFVLCSNRRDSTVTVLLQIFDRGIFVSENDIISHHPDGPTKYDEDVKGESNIQEGFPGLKDLRN